MKILIVFVFYNTYLKIKLTNIHFFTCELIVKKSFCYLHIKLNKIGCSCFGGRLKTTSLSCVRIKYSSN